MIVIVRPRCATDPVAERRRAGRPCRRSAASECVNENETPGCRISCCSGDSWGSVELVAGGRCLVRQPTGVADTELPLPLALHAATWRANRFPRWPSQRDLTTDFKDARHGFGLSNAVVRESGHGAHVMREQYPLIPGGPLQYCRVVRPGQSNVLDANDICVAGRRETANDVVVEVLVGEHPQHAGSSCRVWRASRRAAPPRG